MVWYWCHYSLTKQNDIVCPAIWHCTEVVQSSKGQLISKGNFSVFNSAKNELENVTGAEIFRSFFGRIVKNKITLKVAFFSKCDVFFKSPNLQNKNISTNILNLKFKFPANNSKLQIQISSSGQFFGIFLVWRLGDLKNKSHFLKKKSPLNQACFKSDTFTEF